MLKYLTLAVKCCIFVVEFLFIAEGWPIDNTLESLTTKHIPIYLYVYLYTYSSAVLFSSKTTLHYVFKQFRFSNQQ